MCTECVQFFWAVSWQVWDVRRKGCIYTYKGHEDVVHSIQFSPDGKWIVSASEDGSAKVLLPHLFNYT